MSGQASVRRTAEKKQALNHEIHFEQISTQKKFTKCKIILKIQEALQSKSIKAHIRLLTSPAEQ
jgi:hypothetical protein